MTKAMLIFRDNAAERATVSRQPVAVRHLGDQPRASHPRRPHLQRSARAFPRAMPHEADFNAALGAIARADRHGDGKRRDDPDRSARSPRPRRISPAAPKANAASLEQTSAAVTQMDRRLKATAEAAGRTVARADGAIATVAGGRGIADEAVQAMTRVGDSAKGIDGGDRRPRQDRLPDPGPRNERRCGSRARAGEAGRGFAVVADLGLRSWPCAPRRKPAAPASSSPPPRPISAPRSTWSGRSMARWPTSRAMWRGACAARPDGRTTIRPRRPRSRRSALRSARWRHPAKCRDGRAKLGGRAQARRRSRRARRAGRDIQRRHSRTAPARPRLPASGKAPAPTAGRPGRRRQRPSSNGHPIDPAREGARTRRPRPPPATPGFGPRSKTLISFAIPASSPDPAAAQSHGRGLTRSHSRRARPRDLGHRWPRSSRPARAHAPPPAPHRRQAVLHMRRHHGIGDAVDQPVALQPRARSAPASARSPAHLAAQFAENGACRSPARSGSARPIGW